MFELSCPVCSSLFTCWWLKQCLGLFSCVMFWGVFSFVDKIVGKRKLMYRAQTSDHCFWKMYEIWLVWQHWCNYLQHSNTKPMHLLNSVIYSSSSRYHIMVYHWMSSISSGRNLNDRSFFTHAHFHLDSSFIGSPSQCSTIFSFSTMFSVLYFHLVYYHWL